MITHRRWLCDTCHREWLFARNWTEHDGCPGCHGSAIRLVEYRAEPGGDIPRGEVRPVLDAAPTAVAAQPAPLTLVRVTTLEFAQGYL